MVNGIHWWTEGRARPDSTTLQNKEHGFIFDARLPRSADAIKGVYIYKYLNISIDIYRYISLVFIYLQTILGISEGGIAYQCSTRRVPVDKPEPLEWG